MSSKLALLDSKQGAVSRQSGPAGLSLERPRLLVLSTLYPSEEFPSHGIFLENRVRNLIATGAVDAKVMCPTPWFPFSSRWAGKYGRYAKVPNRDVRYGIEIFYPRFPVLPRVGMHLAPLLMAAAISQSVRNIIAEGFDFDLLDSYYMYPDGVAAALIARRLKKPYMMTAFGTDISLIPQYTLPRRMIQWAGRHASGMTAVCQALKDAMVGIGLDGRQIQVVLHGVDLELFSPGENRDLLRAKLGMTNRSLLSVGHLIERKGHHIIIEALAQLPDVELFVVGDGELSATLLDQASRLGVKERVHFIGRINHANLPDYYRAADALVLCSSREGIANVLMEAMACGLPVMATAVWGAPEVVNSPDAGVLIEERSPAGVVSTFHKLFANYPDRRRTRAHIEGFSWDQTSADHLAVVHSALTKFAACSDA